MGIKPGAVGVLQRAQFFHITAKNLCAQNADLYKGNTASSKYFCLFRIVGPCSDYHNVFFP